MESQQMSAYSQSKCTVDSMKSTGCTYAYAERHTCMDSLGMTSIFLIHESSRSTKIHVLPDQPNVRPFHHQVVLNVCSLGISFSVRRSMPLHWWPSTLSCEATVLGLTPHFHHNAAGEDVPCSCQTLTMTLTSTCRYGRCSGSIQILWRHTINLVVCVATNGTKTH